MKIILNARTILFRFIGKLFIFWENHNAGKRQSFVSTGTLIYKIRKSFRNTNALGLNRVLGLGFFNTAWELIYSVRSALGRSGCASLNSS